MQRRLHPRVRLQLPARLRWSAPFGQQTEECRTRNVSRSGLLLESSQSLRPGHPLLVTFPFDPENAGALGESVARVVRCTKSGDGNPARWNLAIEFAGLPAHAKRAAPGRPGSLFRNGNGHGHDVALPIRVRPKTIPWHEDAMTIEVSPDQLKFQTNREYEFGERLMIAFATPRDNPWSGDGESETEVVGIETSAGIDSLQVTVSRKVS